MAPRIDNKGSALLEAAGILGVLVIFTTGIFLITYLLFARAWIQYQSEQGLYCLAETNSPAECARRMKARTESFLPWGEVQRAELTDSSNLWKVDLKWHWRNYHWREKREMSVRQIQKIKALSWSP